MSNDVKYFIDGNEVLEKPSNGELFTEKHYVDGQVVLEVTTTALTPEQLLQVAMFEEREWRNSEIALVVPLINESQHPYAAELELYMQELRDYPGQEDFPYGTRPTRPVTSSGSSIII